MPIKEKPLLDAEEKLGPLPGFLFSHPLIAGFFAIMMCPIFGAIFVIFQSSIYGSVSPLQLYNSARIGAILATGFAFLVLLLIAFSALRKSEQIGYWLAFVFGGIVAIAALAAADALSRNYLLENLADYGSVF
ncbi:MAG: hypothetical protein AAGB02_02450 [Pseudomonadota bacterium]